MTCNPFHRSLPRADVSLSFSQGDAPSVPRRQNDSASACGRSASELRGTQTHSHPALPGRDSTFFVSVVLPVRRNKVSKSHALACVATPNVTLLCWLIFFKRHETSSITWCGRKTIYFQWALHHCVSNGASRIWMRQRGPWRNLNICQVWGCEWVETKVLCQNKQASFDKAEAVRRIKFAN